MTKKISISICKKRLATTWFVGAGILFLLFFIQSVLGRFSDRIMDAWGWFLPNLVPTLSLMIGVLVAETIKDNQNNKEIDPFIFKLALALSYAYFIILSSTILLKPFNNSPLIEYLNTSNLWLAPLQGLATAALGVFFVNAEKNEEFDKLSN